MQTPEPPQGDLFAGMPDMPVRPPTLEAADVEADEGEEPTTADRALAFHRANPTLFWWLLREALRLVDAGAPRLGMRQLFEHARREWWLSGQGRQHGDYKLNNSFTAFYSRLLETVEPRVRGKFEQRRVLNEEGINDAVKAAARQLGVGATA